MQTQLQRQLGATSAFKHHVMLNKVMGQPVYRHLWTSVTRHYQRV
ncbi:hypothetical protein CZ787_09595 [Halomonas citrativorans]|uniref:Uncharacterized protein n=1 Tax=Halomonas citrativorans TaxID=2742612 RepID=A0A1R4I014_9GAMM|nr:hypothetical protein CZ787_09595 [Halomonas citrativorans]